MVSERMYVQRCIECGREYAPEDVVYTCECGGLLEVVYELDDIDPSTISAHGKLGVWKYKSLLPIERKPITLEEGGTPLYSCGTLAHQLGLERMYVKHEGMNPTGSFKDRGMTVGVSKALELGMKVVACASTGNTSASLAIYGAKANIPAVVLLPSGKVALGKVAQAMMHGAKVLSIRGNFDEALELVRKLCESKGFYLLNSINPYRLEGQKTIAFEVAEALGWSVPDWVVLPVGNAGNISAIYKGFWELEKLGITDGIPRMCGIQAEGSKPVADAFAAHRDDIVPEMRPETVATAIRIGNPVNARKALAAIYQSRGYATYVSDAQILEAQRMLAQKEGIGVEPASATSVAGLKKLLSEGIIDTDESVVCITTGHLLKDPETAIHNSPRPIEVDATIEAVMRVVFE
ncbi:MAG: threonine synthase [Methermicoccaceae archaeon]